jgi:ATP-dependent Clp protease ATP-binding subunit ClpC
MHQDILERFSTHLRNTLSRSIDLAWELRQESIPPVFLLLGLSEQQGSRAEGLLKNHDLSAAEIAEHIRNQVTATTAAQAGPTETGPDDAVAVEEVLFLWPEFAPATKRFIERAAVLAFESRHPYIGTEHLLLALLEYPDVTIGEFFTEHRIPVETLTQQVKAALTAPAATRGARSQAGTTSPADGPVPTATSETSAAAAMTAAASDTPALDYFGTELTAADQVAKLDPVIGRQVELDRLVQILSRRTKNNPVLIGEPGVGKTAIVEGLAKRIADGAVPDILLHKRLFSLDLSLLVAGTMYRGEFESRLKQVMEELRQNPDILLFIDEIHSLVGTGSVQGGTMDAANILKPALAKGQIRCIGATTVDEYRKHIENDPALERRFQPIVVEEPTEAQAEEILRGLRQYYEEFHHVQIPDEVIAAAVRLAVRYLPEKRLPDKAIDLIDEAGARARVHRNVPESLKTLGRLTHLLAKLRQRKEQAVRSEQFQTAVELKEKERQLQEKIAVARRSVQRLHLPATRLTTADLTRVVAAASGVPENHISAAPNRQNNDLRTGLQARIVGQDEAINKVASVLKRSLAGLAAPHRPLGSFLFLGPSGVGKTELAKTLAHQQFGDRNALIRIDMSEFSESFTVSKLIGAPAGYVGYNDRVKFSDQIRRRPHSVVLFDEIEKAHPEIFHVLLQVLDEGRLTDAGGRLLNFRNAVIILTSNVGLDLLNAQAAIGFEDGGSAAGEPLPFADVEQILRDELREVFPVEFLNRIDHTIVFRPLENAALKAIVRLQFAELSARLAERGVRARLLPSAVNAIVASSHQPHQGARLIRRSLTDLVEDPLADLMLRGRLRQGDQVTIGASKSGNGKSGEAGYRITLTPQKGRR